jgi:methionyl aminopeptidase
MSIRSQRELAGMRAAGRVVALALRAMREAVRPGVTTAELDAVGAQVFADHGARSAPQLVYGFPGVNCISVNDEAVHGIPSGRTLAEGDLVTLDVTAELHGFMADAATTVPVGPAAPEAVALVGAAERALARAIRLLRPGLPLNEIGRAVQDEVESAGFHVLPALTGHGIGRTIHEAPTVHNSYEPDDETVLGEGLVFTIEPIVAVGTEDVVLAPDGWAVCTADGSLASHAEHTVVVTRRGALVLTA